MGDLVDAEYRRDSAVISEYDLGHHDPAVRRAAARALSQIVDDRSVLLLGRALGDEDPTVVGWAAYGLGAGCHSRESKTVRALAARAASLVVRPPAAAETGIFDLDAVIADALARCASSEAEATLRAWLGGPQRRADAAAVAIGRLAAQNARLDDVSVVALLDVAARSDRPLEYALYPLTRLGGLGEPAEERLAAVLGPALGLRGPRRAFALRALGRTGQRGAARLGAIVTDRGFSPTERASAARELGGLGEAGQTALGKALEGLVPRDGHWETLLGPEYGTLLAALEALGADSARRLRPVAELSTLPAGDDTPPALKRRLVRLRCRAAALLAGRSIRHPKLVACDPDPHGRIGALAQIAVLGQSEIRGPSFDKWRSWARSHDPVVRQAALGLMPGHPEIPRPAEVLVEALRAKEDGTVAAAAQVLAAYPDRASEEARPRGDQGSGLKPATSLVQALTEALAAKRPPDAVQRSGALVDAVGALGLLSLKPVVADGCVQPIAALRLHAEKALRLLGEGTRQCDRGSLPRGSRFERYPSGRRARLKFFTDAGVKELALDPTWAPVAVRRVVDLGRSGFYNGTVVHRVIPGFVVQFGDPGGDGYGGAGRQPVPSETAPITFGERAVGLAASGRDTGSSQLFVALGAYPHLDGDYAWIGTAGEGWDSVAEGDVIERVEVVE
jgi:cyclophilin family peptidyl-prolyl cis-trans isomerase/HEAT repeat protein